MLDLAQAFGDAVQRDLGGEGEWSNAQSRRFKPVIYTCRKGHISEVHFDTNHHLIVEWDPDGLDRTATALKNTIRATLPADANLEDEE